MSLNRLPLGARLSLSHCGQVQMHWHAKPCLAQCMHWVAT